MQVLCQNITRLGFIGRQLQHRPTTMRTFALIGVPGAAAAQLANGNLGTSLNRHFDRPPWAALKLKQAFAHSKLLILSLNPAARECCSARRRLSTRLRAWRSHVGPLVGPGVGQAPAPCLIGPLAAESAKFVTVHKLRPITGDGAAPRGDLLVAPTGMPMHDLFGRHRGTGTRVPPRPGRHLREFVFLRVGEGTSAYAGSRKAPTGRSMARPISAAARGLGTAYRGTTAARTHCCTPSRTPHPRLLYLHRSRARATATLRYDVRARHAWLRHDLTRHPRRHALIGHIHGPGRPEPEGRIGGGSRTASLRHDAALRSRGPRHRLPGDDGRHGDHDLSLRRPKLHHGRRRR